jgi:hypothetical protein
VNIKDFDPAIVRIHPMKEEDVGAIAVIDGVYFGSPGLEHYRDKFDSATKGAGINTSLVAEARTSMSQVDCKG